MAAAKALPSASPGTDHVTQQSGRASGILLGGCSSGFCALNTKPTRSQSYTVQTADISRLPLVRRVGWTEPVPAPPPQFQLCFLLLAVIYGPQFPPAVCGASSLQSHALPGLSLVKKKKSIWRSGLFEAVRFLWKCYGNQI